MSVIRLLPVLCRLKQTVQTEEKTTLSFCISYTSRAHVACWRAKMFCDPTSQWKVLHTFALNVLVHRAYNGQCRISTHVGYSLPSRVSMNQTWKKLNTSKNWNIKIYPVLWELMMFSRWRVWRRLTTFWDMAPWILIEVDRRFRGHIFSIFQFIIIMPSDVVL
jgi:hypothetical protein